MTLKRKLTPEEKAQIIHLHQTQGLSGPEIADHMHIDDARQVVGVIRAAVNFKKIPGMKPNVVPGAPMTNPPPAPKAASPEPPVLTPPPEAQAVITMAGAAPAHTPAATAPRFSAVPPVHHAEPRAPSVPHAPAPAPAPAAPAPDGFGGQWAQAPGYVSGFNFQAPTRKYMVYRDEPTQDGLLGEHVDPFTEQDVAKTYGQGVYRILRFDPGNPRPFQTQVRVSSNYGPPRFGNRQTQERPGYGRWGQRPWFGRTGETSREEEGVNEPPYERPRSMYDFARHAPAPSSDATAAAIKALGDLNSKALDQVDRAQRQGPDTFISKFFTEQQERQREQLEQQRRQDDQRRREEEEKWERRQKEAEREYQRRQEEEQKRHERELEKIKLEMQAREKAREEERKMLLDLEEKRLQVIRDEHRMRQDALQDELKRNREEQKEREIRIDKQLSEMQAATAAEIHEQQEKLQRELQREREQLDREHKLREKHLDKEHELNTKVLEVKQQQLENQGTNEIFTVVNNLINKFSSGLKEVVDLKKIEATTNMAPEAQAAAVVHSMGKKAEETAADASAEAPKPAAPASGGSTNGNGHAAPAAAAQTEERPMEEIIQGMVEQPFFQKVLKEWALHVKTGQNATTFVNMYMNWMNDPQDHEGRKATTMFANFIAPRPWSELYAVIKPKLKTELQKIFETKDAEEYYETFRALVTESIAAYWEGVAQEREAVKAARRAAAKGSEKAEEPSKK